MAKKKKSKKKFRAGQSPKKKKQRVSQPAVVSVPARSETGVTEESAIKQPTESSAKVVQADEKTKKKNNIDSRFADYDYVRSDLRRSFVISGSIIAALVLLWVLFEHTGVGPAIYHLIKI